MSTSDWGAGYDAGNAGLLQAIATAELIATQRERSRIIKLLEPYAECQGYCGGYCECERSDMFIALIKGEQE